MNDMEPPSIDDVFQAVFTLYNDPNPQEKEKASVWLGKLQKSLHSWKISDELLQQKRNLESCYFAAQTMRTKIQHSFHELPPEAHSSLRDSLLEHISLVTHATNSVIVTQLCLALADLALQMSSWTNPVEDLVKKYASSNVWALLEIMTVIPEEVMSRSLRLGANRRNEIKQYLLANSTTVNAFLEQTLNNSGQNTQVSIKIIKCLTSWISIKAISLNGICENGIVAHSFQVLGDHMAFAGLHEAAADCICILLKCLEENNNNEMVERIIFSSVASLDGSYHLAVAHEDQEKAINYSRVFTELGESFLDKIVNYDNAKEQSHFAIKALDLVLICVGHHDYEVAEISFNLWYRLSENLYKKDDEALSNIFKPYAERLVSALCRHCQMEPDHQGLLDKEDEFDVFRQRVLDLTKDIVFIIGSSHCFKQMFISLQGSEVSWEQTEAALYIMQAIAKNILPEEYEVVPKVVEAILGMPDTAHIAVRYTSILLLGQLCEWIEQHPECLQATLECLLLALQHQALASAAAHSLQSICSACRNHMDVHLTGLLQIVRSLESFCLSLDAAIDLLRGVAAIIGCLPHEQITSTMREVCLVQLAPLATLCTVNVAISKNTSSDPTLWLDRLAALFRYCRLSVENGQTHPCLPVLSDVWPVLSTTMDRYSSDLRVMERLCRCLRFAVRTLGWQGAALLETLSKQMVVIYATQRHSCFLYLGSILVDEFYGDASCILNLMEMLQALIGPAFDLLRQPSGLGQNPDTVDDLFRFCGRFLKRIPVHFLQSPALNAVLECALLACSLAHRDANSSVMKFLFDLVSLARPPQADQRSAALVGVALTHHGEALVGNLIHASVFCIHSYMLSDVAEVFWELLSWNRDLVAGWIETALGSLSPQNSASATPAQLAHFHTTVTQPKSTKIITQSLKDLARLYH